MDEGCRELLIAEVDRINQELKGYPFWVEWTYTEDTLHRFHFSYRLYSDDDSGGRTQLMAGGSWCMSASSPPKHLLPLGQFRHIISMFLEKLTDPYGDTNT